MNWGHTTTKCVLKSSTENTPQFIWPICPNRPIIWDIFEKNSHQMSILYAIKVCNCRFLVYYIYGQVAGIGKPGNLPGLLINII